MGPASELTFTSLRPQGPPGTLPMSIDGILGACLGAVVALSLLLLMQATRFPRLQIEFILAPLFAHQCRSWPLLPLANLSASGLAKGGVGSLSATGSRPHLRLSAVLRCLKRSIDYSDELLSSSESEFVPPAQHNATTHSADNRLQKVAQAELRARPDARATRSSNPSIATPRSCGARP